jgi:hypothetical protein
MAYAGKMEYTVVDAGAARGAAGVGRDAAGVGRSGALVGRDAAASQHKQTLRVFFWMLVAAVFLVGSSVAVVRSGAGCRVSLQLPRAGPADDELCNAHACDARVEDIRFELGNCSDRSALRYCYLDVEERPFYGPELCLSAELGRGVRVFFVDVHLHGARLRACHRWCTVKLLSIEDMLSTFAEFLRVNPREVLLLWWFPAGDVQRILSELELAYLRTGLAPYEFLPEQPAWPTIGELVARNTRLLSLSGPAGVASRPLAPAGGLQ